MNTSERVIIERRRVTRTKSEEIELLQIQLTRDEEAASNARRNLYLAENEMFRLRERSGRGSVSEHVLKALADARTEQRLAERNVSIARERFRNALDEWNKEALEVKA